MPVLTNTQNRTCILSPSQIRNLRFMGLKRSKALEVLSVINFNHFIESNCEVLAGRVKTKASQRRGLYFLNRSDLVS